MFCVKQTTFPTGRLAYSINQHQKVKMMPRMNVTKRAKQMKADLSDLQGNPMKLANAAARMTQDMLDMIIDLDNTKANKK